MKIKKIILLLFSVLLLSSCSISTDNLEDAKIYVTNYPIKYIVQTLYGKHSSIESIYPADADTTTYELSDKQIKQYAKENIFVYNGLTSEKNLAKSFINKNKKILIMDVSYGLSVQNNVEELWLSPNNYLMLAKNVRDNFKEYLTNKSTVQEVVQNYDKFAETMSSMDADLRDIGKSAINANNSIIVVPSKGYKFLENYGFTVISLDDDAYQTTTGINNLKRNFKNGKYLALITNPDNPNDITTDLVTNCKAKEIKLPSMTKGTNTEDYISVMQTFIENLKNSI